jgi:hypothetical protein
MHEAVLFISFVGVAIAVNVGAVYAHKGAIRREFESRGWTLVSAWFIWVDFRIVKIGSLYRVIYLDKQGNECEGQVSASVIFGVTVRKSSIYRWAPREEGASAEKYLDAMAEPTLGEDDLIFDEDER